MPAPAHEPTAATRGAVESMIAYGIPQAEIARSIGISEPTLRKHYRDEIDTAATKANARVAQTLYKMATDPSHKSCAASAMFWAKTRMGWRETTHVEMTGKDSGPIQHEASVSDDLRQALDAIAGKLAGGAGADEVAGDSTSDTGRAPR